MAVATTTGTGHGPSLLAGIGTFILRIVENHPHTRQIEKLNAMSDAELAARGVTREDVVRHIFRERYYI